MTEGTTNATSGDQPSSSASEEASTVPPVVAVVVTCNPGPWFEESLQALGDQDYPNLAVLVVDAASIEDPLPRIAEALPHAYVRRLNRNPGYAAATNRALRIVQGASHFVLCHDDVAPAPDAIRKMMEEAFRQNAGVVVPKQVSWDDPNILLAMGGTTDRTSALIPAIEPGEFDQGQHDTPSDVVVATGGCLLVRADLFETLGGFDASMTLFGEDIDFSLRAQLAGARIVTAPMAKVRHLQAASKRLRLAMPTAGVDEGDDEEEVAPVIDEFVLRRRHRLRTVLKVRRRSGLLITVVHMAALTLVESLYSLTTNRSGHVSALMAAWVWNITHWRDLMRARRQLRKVRSVDDKVIDARLGSARNRLEGVVRREWELRRERLHKEGWGGRDVVGVVRNLTFAVWATVAAVWFIGSRSLLGDDPIPAVGRFMELPGSPVTSLQQYFGVLPAEGFGTSAFSSPTHLIAAAIGILLFGATGLALKVLVLAPLPLGIWGIIRLTRPLGSTRARLGAVAAYAALPLPYDAFGLGRLDVLIAYAAAPWILHRLLRAHATSPYVSRRASDRLRVQFHRPKQLDDEELEALIVSNPQGDHLPVARMTDASEMLDAEVETKPAASIVPAPDTGRALVMFVALRRIIPLALLLATAGTFAPQLLPAVIVAAVLIVFGSFISGIAKTETAERTLVIVTVLIASAIAFGLLLPSLLESAAGLRSLFETPSGSEGTTFLEILRLDTGGDASSMLSLGLVLAGIPALAFGSDWRFRLSVKLWFVVVGSVALVWVGSHGWLGPVAFDPMPFLAIAGAAMALNVGVSVHSLTQDLRTYQYGWRHAMPVLAVVGIAVSFVPVAQRAGNGTWGLPQLSTAELLSWVDDRAAEGSFRVLWLGSESAMPGGAMPLGDDVFAGVAENTAVPNGPALPADGLEAQDAIKAGVADARKGNTVSLGRTLGLYDIRYVTVPTATGTLDNTHIDTPPPADLVDALRDQLDLIVIDSDASVLVFENKAWLPTRAALSPEATLAARNNLPDQTTGASDFSSMDPVLPLGGGRMWRGDVPAGETFVGESESPGWRLSVDGQQAAKQSAFGWAQSFSTGDGGFARLSYRPPVVVPVVQSALLVAWLILASLAFKFRARRGRYT